MHDFFYGDLRYINVIERKYMLNAHPYFAYYNASKIFKYTKVANVSINVITEIKIFDKL